MTKVFITLRPDQGLWVQKLLRPVFLISVSIHSVILIAISSNYENPLQRPSTKMNISIQKFANSISTKIKCLKL